MLRASSKPIQLNSSNIKSVVYDEKAHALTVEFHSTHRYKIHNVTNAEYSGLLNAASPGKYFAAQLRDKRHTEL